MNDTERHVVVADGFVVSEGPFQDAEDAQDFANAWNHAYPHGPWFKAATRPIPAVVSSSGGR